MAKISFDTIENQPVNESGENAGNYSVKFFALKNGESAIVRILCDSVDDIDIYTVHNVITDQWKFGRRMSCVRDPHDPIDNCPLCAANKPLMQRMYVKMIQYVTDPQTNQVVPTAVVWERGANDRQFGARTLKGLLDTFGPLSNFLCKISRQGEKLETTYQVIPNLPANVYPDNLYPADRALFGDYEVAGRAFIDRSAEDYRVFLATGNFPNPNTQATPKNEPPVSIPPASNAYGNGFANTAGAANMTGGYATPSYNATANFQAPPVSTTQPQFTAPTNTAAPMRETLPWETPAAAPANNVGFERPVRRY